MSEAQEIADLIGSHLPEMRQGSLCFWGAWFGRPLDNCHRIVSCEAKGELLKITFDKREILSVWSPRNLEASKNGFRISDASKVRWEWFYSGRPDAGSNRYFMEFANHGGTIGTTTNVPRSTSLEGNASAPAVEMY